MHHCIGGERLHLFRKQQAWVAEAKRICSEKSQKAMHALIPATSCAKEAGSPVMKTLNLATEQVGTDAAS